MYVDRYMLIYMGGGGNSECAMMNNVAKKEEIK